MTSLNIVFAGTPEFGLPCLAALHRSTHRVQAIYTQPDRPAGRSLKLQACAVKKWALEQDLPVHQPLHFKNPESVAQLSHLQPDLMIVIAYGLILPQAVLEIPRLGCINVHASLLPRWRGASPIQQAILHGDKESGITIMQMDVGMDTGNALAKITCSVSLKDTAGSLHDILSEIAVKPLLETVDALAHDSIHSEVQDNNLATYAAKINKQDALVHWQDSAVEIDRQIRAFNPWPIAYTMLNNESLRIYQAQIVALESQEAPGTILKIDRNGMLVVTGKDGLLITTLQFPGGKVISVADWLHSGKASFYVGHCLQ